MLIASIASSTDNLTRPDTNYAQLLRVALANGLMLHLIIAHTHRCALKRTTLQLVVEDILLPDTYIAANRNTKQSACLDFKTCTHPQEHIYSGISFVFVAALLHWSNVLRIVFTSAHGDSSGSSGHKRRP